MNNREVETKEVNRLVSSIWSLVGHHVKTYNVSDSTVISALEVTKYKTIQNCVNFNDLRTDKNKDSDD